MSECWPELDPKTLPTILPYLVPKQLKKCQNFKCLKQCQMFSRFGPPCPSNKKRQNFANLFIRFGWLKFAQKIVIFGFRIVRKCRNICVQNFASNYVEFRGTKQTKNCINLRIEIQSTFAFEVSTQCGNFIIFLSIRFYVKSILEILLEVQNLPFW